MAEHMIKEIHPLAETPIDVAFPVLFCWWTFIKKCCMKSQDEVEDSHKQIIEDLDDKIAQTKDKQARKRLKEQKRIQE